MEDVGKNKVNEFVIGKNILKFVQVFVCSEVGASIGVRRWKWFELVRSWSVFVYEIVWNMYTGEVFVAHGNSIKPWHFTVVGVGVGIVLICKTDKKWDDRW